MSKAVAIINGNHKKGQYKSERPHAAFDKDHYTPLPIPYSSPSNSSFPPPTHTGSSVHVPCKWRLRTVLLWLLYVCICLWALCIVQRTHAEQCYCMSECHQTTTMCSTTLNNIYAYVRTCTEVRIQWQTMRGTRKVCRTRMAKDRVGSTGQLWHMLQMVQRRLLSEVSLTSVLPRSITVSSLVGCESVWEGNRQGQRKGTYHYMRFTLQKVTTHCSMWTGRHRARGESSVLETSTNRKGLHTMGNSKDWLHWIVQVLQISQSG